MTEAYWSAYGEYTGDDCPNCHRQRLMQCTDSQDRERIICEKCHWEPAMGDFAPDAAA